MYLKSVLKRLTYVNLIIFFFLLQHNVVKAQFAIQTSNISLGDSWNDVAVDDDGYIYVVGSYNTQTQISQLPIPTTIFNPSPNGKDQLVVAKFDPADNLIWYAIGKKPCPILGQTTGKLITLDQNEGTVYISGDHAGMWVSGANVSDGTSWDFGPQEYVNSICTGSDDDMLSYIMQFKMSDGAYGGWYDQYRGPIDAITVDNYGIYAADLYIAMNGDYSNPAYTSFVNRIETPSLLPTDLINTGSNFPHSINDIYYRYNKIYFVGTTTGPLAFIQSGPNLNFSPNSQVSVAWVGSISNTGSMQVLNLQYGGDGSWANTPANEVTGEQISMDMDGNLFIAGLFNENLINPFNSGIFNISSNPQNTSGYLLRLNANTLDLFDNIHSMETVAPFEVSAIEMNSEKYDVYVSLTYSGKRLNFFPNTGDDINLNTSTPIPNDNEKVAIINYDHNPFLTKQRHNTTSGYSANDKHFSKANAVGFHYVYTVGKFQGEMQFEALMSSPNSNLNTSSSLLGGFVIRNDYDWANGNGTFKNNNSASMDKIKSIDISIYPNPNNGSFYMDGINAKDRIELFDNLGKSLKFSSEISEERAFIKIENPSSICILKINDVGYPVYIK